jgi:tetratricopeptide (TPR) repeat protein
LGCTAIKGIKNRHAVFKQLQRGQRLLEKRDYKGSLQENQKVLSLFDETPHKDKALFNIGLIYGHYDNPEKDYNESLRYFEKLIQNYPQSPLVEQAKMWTNLLKDISDSKIKDDEITKAQKIYERFEFSTPERRTIVPSISKEHLNRAQDFLTLGNYKKALEENKNVLSLTVENSHKDEALFNMGMIYAHYGNPEKDYKKSSEYFNELIKEYPQSHLAEQAKIWLGLYNVIEREKQVDIEIEKKKKELKDNNGNGLGKDFSGR